MALFTHSPYSFDGPVPYQAPTPSAQSYPEILSRQVSTTPMTTDASVSKRPFTLKKTFVTATATNPPSPNATNNTALSRLSQHACDSHHRQFEAYQAPMPTNLMVSQPATLLPPPPALSILSPQPSCVSEEMATLTMSCCYTPAYSSDGSTRGIESWTDTIPSRCVQHPTKAGYDPYGSPEHDVERQDDDDDPEDSDEEDDEEEEEVYEEELVLENNPFTPPGLVQAQWSPNPSPQRHGDHRFSTTHRFTSPPETPAPQQDYGRFNPIPATAPQNGFAVGPAAAPAWHPTQTAPSNTAFLPNAPPQHHGIKSQHNLATFSSSFASPYADPTILLAMLAALDVNGSNAKAMAELAHELRLCDWRTIIAARNNSKQATLPLPLPLPRKGNNNKPISTTTRRRSCRPRNTLQTTPCVHVGCWKRLRAKRGYGYYVCQECQAKWKTASTSLRAH